MIATNPATEHARNRLTYVQAAPMTIGSICTGYGGLDMAAEAIFGAELAWWSDVEPGPVAVMQHHTDRPNIGDIKTADWYGVEPVDILTAGYPCQPFSNAGKRLGTADPRHLWPFIAEAIGVLRPQIIVLENVAAHLRRGFDIVTQELTALGYDAAWALVRAADIGAPHRRERLFVVAAADPDRAGLERSSRERGQARRPEPAGHSAAQNANLAAGGQRRLAAPGQTESGRPRADTSGRGGAPIANAIGEPVRQQSGRLGGPRGSGETIAGHPGEAATDALRERREEPPQCHGQPVTGEDGQLGHDADRRPRAEAWGDYAPAIDRWERITSRLAPDPTMAGKRGSNVLAPRFVEWMMGLPDGHVTAVDGLTRNQQLKLLGNGVVPQQAAHAVRLIIDSWAEMVT